MKRFPLFVALLLPFVGASGVAAQPARKVEFNRDVRPILAVNCFTCHGPAKSTRKAGLRLDTQDGLFAEEIIVPGQLTRSKMWDRVSSSDPKQVMPPPGKNRKPLSPEQLAALRQWIEQGAPWQKHWAFIPPQRPIVPQVKDADWAKNPIDTFILARLEEAGLPAAPPASRETLIRRVTLDLTGLPPTLSEIDAFLNDPAPDAYEKLVERLLASPRYGERMVLEWLDAARYSDTNGYQTDGARAMWPWRDWVIDALNRNRPFDQFTIEQIAGDLLPGATVPQRIATGFHRNHMLNGEGGRIAEESRVDYVVDRVDTTGTIWLGLTVGCARCHEHKYDPLPQKEYYQLFAFFNNIAEVGGVDRRNSTAAPVLELPTEEQKLKIAALEKGIAEKQRHLDEVAKKRFAGLDAWEKDHGSAKLPDKVAAALKVEKAKRSDEQTKAIKDHFLTRFPETQQLQQVVDADRKELSAVRNSVLITMVMEERKEPRQAFVLVRGNYDKYGEQVQPDVPRALRPLPSDAPRNRLGLARWLVARDNPLTSRVTVNRYWQQFFGIGLVKTAEDFGVQGELPSHPELLDWLATDFMSDWNVKRLHKLIVTSATYRQSARVNPAVLERDPDNRLLSHGPRLRLSPFLLRDQALALSGLLSDRVGGPPVRPYQPPGLWEDFSFNQIRYTQDHGESLYRRSLYTFWRRSIGPPNMFDTPARQICTVRPSRTNTPLHALILMNDVTFVEAARVWAGRLMKEPGTPEERLSLAFRMATARPPTSAERTLLVAGWHRLQKQFAADRPAAQKLVSIGEYPRDARLDVAEHAAYTAMLNTILNLDEVICKE
jgi:mono/diheme cytochrome c family protein